MTTHPRTRMRPATLIRAAGCALVLAVIVIGWPRPLGGATGYTIVAGHSMEPTLRHGDLVVTRRVSAPEVGDVIVYRVTAVPHRVARVVHRVVGHDSRGLLTRGDNRGTIDPFRPRMEQVDGRVVGRVPGLGFAIALAATPLMLAVVAGVCVFLAVLPARPPDSPARRHREIPRILVAILRPAPFRRRSPAHPPARLEQPPAQPPAGASVGSGEDEPRE